MLQWHPSSLCRSRGALLSQTQLLAATTCAIGDAIPAASSAFWNQYKAGIRFDLQADNPNYIGNYLSAGQGVPLGMIAPDYKTPVSVQMNIGIQRQIIPGMVLSVDYLRNVQTQFPAGH